MSYKAIRQHEKLILFQDQALGGSVFHLINYYFMEVINVISKKVNLNRQRTTAEGAVKETSPSAELQNSHGPFYQAS